MKLILDAGGVIVYPAFGHWRYGAAMLRPPVADTLTSEAYLRAHEACKHFMREDVRIDTEAEEYAMRLRYFEAMNEMVPWGLARWQVEELARDFVENTARMGVYADAHAYLPRFQERFGLGLLSDTAPSLKRVFESAGIWRYFDAHVFSTDVGALKPDPAMYARILALLGARAEDCLFVDDLPRNLRGAEKAGMRAVQMARAENVERWDGPVVTDFAGLEAYLQALEDGVDRRVKVRYVERVFRSNLKPGKIYDAEICKENERIVFFVDENGEEYGYPLSEFEIVEE